MSLNVIRLLVLFCFFLPFFVTLELLDEIAIRFMDYGGKCSFKKNVNINCSRSCSNMHFLYIDSVLKAGEEEVGIQSRTKHYRLIYLHLLNI